MAESTDAWIVRENIRRFEKLLELGGSVELQGRLLSLIAEETRKLTGESSPAGDAMDPPAAG